MRISNLITQYLSADGAGSPGANPDDMKKEPPTRSDEGPDGLHSVQGTTKSSPDLKLTQLISRTLKFLEEPFPNDRNPTEFFNQFTSEVLSLIKAGANPNLEINGTPLLIAVLELSSYYDEGTGSMEPFSTDPKEFIRQLVQAGANLAAEGKNGTLNFLECADQLQLKKDDLYELLLLDPKAVGNLTGKTLLHQLIETYNSSGSIGMSYPEYNAGFAEQVQEMVEAGADPNKRSNEDQSAVDAAIDFDCSDQIKEALGIDVGEAQLSLRELYETERIDELIERRESSEFHMGHEDSGVVINMICKKDIETLRRFLKPNDFSERPDMGADALMYAIMGFRYQQYNQLDKIEEAKEIVLFLLDNGVNPDYFHPMHRFLQTPAEEVRRGVKDLPDEVIAKIREKSLYLTDPNFQYLRESLDKCYRLDSKDPSFPRKGRDTLQPIIKAYNKCLIRPSKENFDQLTGLLIIANNPDPIPRQDIHFEDSDS